MAPKQKTAAAKENVTLGPLAGDGMYTFETYNICAYLIGMGL